MWDLAHSGSLPLTLTHTHTLTSEFSPERDHFDCVPLSRVEWPQRTEPARSLLCSLNVAAFGASPVPGPLSRAQVMKRCVATQTACFRGPFWLLPQRRAVEIASILDIVSCRSPQVGP